MSNPSEQLRRVHLALQGTNEKVSPDDPGWSETLELAVQMRKELDDFRWRRRIVNEAHQESMEKHRRDFEAHPPAQRP